MSDYEIKSISGTTLYVARGAADVRAAVEAAARRRAYLSGANLSRANLTWAYLSADYLLQAMGRNRDIPLGLVG